MDETGRARRTFRVMKNTLCDTIMVDTCHYRCVQNYRTPRVNPNVDHGFWAIIMHQ